MPRKETVTKVVDGDTFMTNRRKHPVRLANVDAPEKGQKGVTQARNFLKDIILDKEFSIDTKARDKYGRSVANVKLGARSVNKAVKSNLK